MLSKASILMTVAILLLPAQSRQQQRVFASPPAGPVAGQGARGRPPADFDGDGFADLAVGALLEDIEGIPNAGAVHVLYGSAVGLTADDSQLWHQDSPGIDDAAEDGDGFGEELHAGDLNGDGFTDLVVGVPFEDVEGVKDGGVVHILYGSPLGLTAEGSQLWRQDTLGLGEEVEANDIFGEELTVGDFDGDGFADLAFGVALEDREGIANSGVVHVLYGAPGGLSAADGQTWHQDSPDVLDQSEDNDHFGEELAPGDLNGDGFDDLVMAASGESLGSAAQAGAVNVLYGSSTGLTAVDNQFWHQDSPDIADQAEGGDRFGSELGVGDLNGDGFADLVVGVFYEDLFSRPDVGAVNVFYGTPGGLSAANNQFWCQSSPRVQGAAEPDDRFGYAVAVGDLNGDGFDDAAIGAPHEDIRHLKNAGVVNVLYGSATGLSAAGNQIWRQENPGITDAAQDFFGWELTADDLNGDGFFDLAVGSPGDDVESARGAGSVTVLHGSSSGLSAENRQGWDQNIPGIDEMAEMQDYFGYSLSEGWGDGP